MYEYQKDPLYQSHVLSIEEIEEAHRRAKKTSFRGIRKRYSKPL